MGLAGCASQAEMRIVRREQRDIRQLLADTRASLDSVRQDVHRLRGSVEETRHDQSTGGQRGSGWARLADLERRVDALERGAVSGVLPPQAGVGERGPSVEGPPSVASELAREEAMHRGRAVDGQYRNALDMVRRGEYRAAIPEFRAFLRAQPASPLADNAQYWIGECYYAMRDFSRAIIEFNEVLLKYDKGDKRPGALLKQAYAFLELGNEDDARLVLQDLVSKYPATDEARLAEERLRFLGG